jgi:hypothetical protein
MTLENLLRIGTVKAHVATREEVDRLLRAATRALGDADVEGVSSTGRLDHAYQAIMQAALAAMMAKGYRPATSEPGHHQLVIHALPLTAGVTPDRVRVLDAFRVARNQADYRGIPVSDAVAREAAAVARAFVADVRRVTQASRA